MKLPWWCGITAAWIAYHEQDLDNEYPSDEDEKKLIAASIVMSTGVNDMKALEVPEDVGRKLLACYKALGESDRWIRKSSAN
ncbi:MAG: hypothetical protein O3C40_34375 [Planctomycetota bacterium]|nr:hypothetical protein [Planctomycetota bacterium]